MRILVLKEPRDEESGPDPYVKELESHGHKATLIPVLSFKFVSLNTFSDKLFQPEKYGGLIFTSPRAVEAVKMCLKAEERRGEWNKSIKDKWNTKSIYVVGKATAASVQSLGLKPLGEDTGTADVLSRLIIEREDTNIPPLFFPCGSIKREVLPTALRENALKEFQMVSGLPVTGVFDEVTKEAMNKPRCGVPDKEIDLNPHVSPESTGGLELGNSWNETFNETDSNNTESSIIGSSSNSSEDDILHFNDTESLLLTVSNDTYNNNSGGGPTGNSNENSSQSQPLRHGEPHPVVLMSKRRLKRDLTVAGYMAFSKDVLRWRLIGEGYSSQLTIEEQRYIFRLAFRMWSEVSPLEFVEDTWSPLEDVDIKLGFGTGGCKGRFSTVFDWIRKEKMPDGEVIIRFNTYFIRDGWYWLYENRNNRTRYGDPVALQIGWHGIPRVPSPIDTAFYDRRDSNIYFFRRTQVYAFSVETNSLARGFPKHIRDVFPPVESGDHPDGSIDVAYFSYSHNALFLLKGTRFWRVVGSRERWRRPFLPRNGLMPHKEVDQQWFDICDVHPTALKLSR
ncbi:hypothetical protein GOODEAATRI_020908 [Goodea atripinnis]|uniref:Uroporphyrinogen-III synthase n=1 Tax=Goodea atripinnis TaxID=208336 RepID=A0ABV0N354_9TELE